MKTVAWISTALAALVFLGCGPTALDRTAQQLAPGMTKANVKSLFVRFRLLCETNDTGKVLRPSRWYGTNESFTSRVVFDVPGLIASEYLVVYFDSNDVIVAAYYFPPG